MVYKKISNKIKLTRAAICVMAALMLSACGKTDDDSKDRTTRIEKDKDSDSNEKADKKNKKDKKNKENKDVDNSGDVDVVTTENAENSQIIYTIAKDYDSLNSDDYSENYANASVAGVVILSDGYEALKNELNSLNNSYYSEYKSFIADTQTYIEEEDTEYAYFPWESFVDIFVTRADSKVFSLYAEDYTYMGGAHGYTGYVGHTFDSKTGEHLNIEDVVKSVDDLYNATYDYLNEIEQDYMLFDSEEENGKKEWENTLYNDFYTDRDYLNWWLEGDEIVLCFNAYELAPFVTGPIFVNLDNDSYDLIKDEYIVKNPNNYFCKKLEYNYYGDNYVCNVDVNNDADEEQVSIDAEYIYDEEYYYLDHVNLDIYFGDSSVNVDYALDYHGAYVMEAPNGKYYLYLAIGVENDYESLVIYDISNPKKGIKEVGYSEAGSFYEITPQDPENIYVTERIQVMGTRSGYTRCYIDNDGQLVSYDGIYRVSYIDYNKVFDDYDYDARLELKKDFEFTVIDNVDSQNEVEKVKVKKGEKFIPYATNNVSPYNEKTESYMILMREDGSLIKVVYDEMGEDDWNYKINGFNEDEIFDGIVYAG